VWHGRTSDVRVSHARAPAWRRHCLSPRHATPDPDAPPYSRRGRSEGRPPNLSDVDGNIGGTVFLIPRRASRSRCARALTRLTPPP
jgi:hypothetical protein